MFVVTVISNTGGMTVVDRGSSDAVKPPEIGYSTVSSSVNEPEDPFQFPEYQAPSSRPGRSA
jgi:hypothetical protein